MMVIAKKYFPSQKASERIFLLIRRHWITYIPLFAIIGFMALPLIIAAIYISANIQTIDPTTTYVAIIVGSIYALFVLSLFLFGFVDYYLDVDIVTNERVVDIEQNGFFHRTISELYLEQVEDVSAKVNGILPTLFNYGDVFIQTAGERENFIFKSVPRPYETSKTIIDLHEAALEGGGGIEKLINRVKEMPGSVSDKLDSPATTPSPDEQQLAKEALTPLPKSKENLILDGINNDKDKVKNGTVTFHPANPEDSQGGEMKEGETVDI